MDEPTRRGWLELGDAEVAPPELGRSLAQVTGAAALEAAAFRGWLIPAEVWVFLDAQRQAEPPAH